MNGSLLVDAVETRDAPRLLIWFLRAQPASAGR